MSNDKAIYNVKLSYEENYEQGPFGVFATNKQQLSELNPKQTFLGVPVNTPFGIAAGPLLNSKYTKAAFLYGFDICVYKTVRAVAQKSHAGINILPIKVDGKLGLNSEKVLVDDDYNKPNLTITNSFGVPSFAPDIWQPDMAKAVQEAGKGQILVGAFQGTPGNSKTIEDDYALTAKLVAQTGAPILEANFSCPNEGVKELLCFDIPKIERIANKIKEAVPDKPLLIKIAYFEYQQELIELIKRIGHIVDGICAINTIPARAVDENGNPALDNNRVESGVCGDAIRWAGLEMTERLYQLRNEYNLKYSIVGMGGLNSDATYQAYIKAGADAGMSATGAMWNPDLALEIKKMTANPNWLSQEMYIPEVETNSEFSKQQQQEKEFVNSKNFKAGIYNEVIKDDWKELQLAIHLSEQQIEKIELLNPDTMPLMLQESFEQITTRIIEANSPYVDSVSGATMQSEEVKNLVTKVMVNASKEKLIEQGQDPDDLSTDVVVIGSGGAGLTAAIQAYDQGAKVTIVEQMSMIGGNTNKASAGMNAAETKFQKLKGILDSKDNFYQETFIAGKQTNNPELLRYLVDHADRAIDWLDQKGITLNDLTTTGGMSTDRTHRPTNKEAVGKFLISGLLKNINQRNIDIILETKAEQIIMDEQGKVSAIKITNQQGESKTIKCKVVIVATGGFGANLPMVATYRADLKDFVTTNHLGANGSGIKLLQEIGADCIDMEKIQIHPTVEQQSSYLITEAIRGGGAILVSQKGVRFVNELDTRDNVSSKIIEQPECYAYIIFDKQIRDNNPATEEYIKQGIVSQADSLDDLANQLNIETNQLINTVERYNKFVQQKQDLDFARTSGMRQPINQVPYYAIKVAPGIHHTMGGIVINLDTEVLDKNQQVIKGVYAVGEVVGGIHGSNRIGGNAIADIITFGIRAGDQSSKIIK